MLAPQGIVDCVCIDVVQIKLRMREFEPGAVRTWLTYLLKVSWCSFKPEPCDTIISSIIALKALEGQQQFFLPPHSYISQRPDVQALA